MEYSKLLIETTDGVALVTINSPRTMNALSSKVLAELLGAFTELEAASAVRAIVLTGAGEKAFVAGANITEMSSCLLYTSPSPRDRTRSRMPSSA